jgi:hypothetical protein
MTRAWRGLGILGQMIRKTFRIREYPIDATKEWHKNESRDLVMDLDTNRLSGVGLGEPLSNFEFLGPCDDFSQMSGILIDTNGKRLNKDNENESYSIFYESLGFSISSDLQFEVDSYIFLFPANDPDGIPFAGDFLFDGNRFTYQDLNSAERVVGLLGKSDECHEKAILDAKIKFPRIAIPKSLHDLRSNAKWMIMLDEEDRVIVFGVVREAPNSCDSGPPG